MSSHERELTISPGEGSVVVPTAYGVTDTFTLKKKSDTAQFSVEDVTIKPHVQNIQYQVTYEEGHILTTSPWGAPVLALKTSVKAVPLNCLTIDINVRYTVAAGLSFPEGQPIVTELTASLTHDKHTETVTTSVFNVVGTSAADPVAEVGLLARTLYADYEGIDTLPGGDIQKLLKNADTTVASIVNSKIPPADVTPEVFAQALAIHDLVDDLYNGLLEKAQPPELVDAVP
ncbi:MAG: hypothetical protein WAK84_09875 [Candidatus Cybelea sp.]